MSPTAGHVRRIALKRQLIEMRGGRCVRCGYDQCLQALQVHHREPKEKLFELGMRNLNAGQMDKLRAEAVKCDVLCANCHAEEHAVW